MAFSEQHIIKSSIEIETTPEKIWDFFLNLEKNYTKWHPEDHVFWRWVNGKPLEVGTKIDSKEIIQGHKAGIKAVVLETIKNKKIVLGLRWPFSIVCPKIEWIIETKGSNCIFTAITYYKFSKAFLWFHNINDILNMTKKHMDEEGENLKKLLELK